MAGNIFKSMATVSGLTMVSRVLGFARQMLLAGVIGASGNPVADAFWAAFRIPNMFRRLLAEGAFQAAFVPLFQGRSVDEDKAAAKAFAADILAWVAVVLTGLSALIMIFTPAFVAVITTGFVDDPERFNLTVLYTRIMFPYLACMSLVGIFGAMLNALHRFGASSAAPLLLNVALIGALLLTAEAEVEVTGLAAAIAVMVGGILQLLALMFGAWRSGLLLRLRRPKWNKGVKRFVSLGTPGFIGAGALQINVIVGTNVASREEGAISWLMYADQLYQLPLSIIGIALGVVLMPAISRSVKSGDEKGALRTLTRGLEIAFFFALPAAAALIVIPQFLTGALFEDLAGDVVELIGAAGSAFNATDVLNTGNALLIYGCGLPAFVCQKVLAAAFFAREDTRSPMMFAFVAIAINATVSIALFPVLGFLSVPLGTICASWTEVSLLARRLSRRGHLAPDRTFFTRLVRLLLVVLVVAGGLYLIDTNRAALIQITFGQSWVLLFAVVAVVMPVYFGLAFLTGGIEKKTFTRVRKAKPAA